jgi:hypothetical protein
MVSFLTGLGGGYIQATDKRRDQERQDKQDAWMNEQRDRQRSEWSERDKLNTGLRDAAAPRSVMEGTVTEGGGNKYLNADPAQASAMQQMLAAEAEMTGGAAPTQQAGRGVVGMTKGNQITTGPADAAGLNTPDAVNSRIADVYRQGGQPEKALSMENAVQTGKMNALSLKDREVASAKTAYNERLMTYARSMGIGPALAKIASETSSNNLNGVAFEHGVSADGKTQSLFRVGENGEKTAVVTLPMGQAGDMQMLQRALQVDPKQVVDWARADAKDKAEESRWQQTFDLSKKKEENDEQYRSRVLGMQQEQNNRARAVHAIAMDDAKIPPAVKLQAQSLAKQIEAVGSALNKAMAEGQFDPNNPGTQKLLEQQAALGIRYRQTLEPYTPGAKANADPLGLMGGATAAPAAPTAAPVAAPTRAASVPRPAAPMQAAVAPPAPATVAQVLAGPSANPVLTGLAQKRSAAIEQVGAQIKAAQAEVVTVARSNPAGVPAAMARVSAARDQLNQALSGMNPAQAKQVEQALGL